MPSDLTGEETNMENRHGVNDLLRRCGLPTGKLPCGRRNTIADVAGVRVGHVTLADGDAQTGVTALIPAPGNLFREKLTAASQVINGFGKTAGLVQIDELGTLETPIVLTNTLSVGDCWRGLSSFMIDMEPQIGKSAGTVNPVVCECNDGFLNDIRAQNVTPQMTLRALENASEDFELGAVGAGRGMSCYQFKGGIGSASRVVSAGGKDYALGCLVLSNFGEMGDFTLCGQPTGEAALKIIGAEKLKEQGSCIVILGTDAPLTSRQLKRLCRRATAGITKTGSIIGNGSGEIAIAFSTAQRIPFDAKGELQLRLVSDAHANLFFRAVIESVNDAILTSMLASPDVTGFMGHRRFSLAHFAGRIPGLPQGSPFQGTDGDAVL